MSACNLEVTKIQPEAREGLEPIDVVVMHAMPFLKYPEVKEAGARLVEQCANKLIKAGYVVDEVVQLGKPADEILKVASKKKVDLIVTGAKGMARSCSCSIQSIVAAPSCTSPIL